MTPDEIHVKRVLELLNAMSEAWAERVGIAQAVRSIPVNCPTPEFCERSHALILRHIKQAYVEGLYAGRMSAVDERSAVE